MTRLAGVSAAVGPATPVDPQVDPDATPVSTQDASQLAVDLMKTLLLLSTSKASDATDPAQARLYLELQRQASNWAFVDVFRWLSLLCFFCVGIVWLFKKVKPGKGPAGAH